MKQYSYYVAAIAAFTIWGFFSFVLKPLSGYASLDILFYRVFFCAVIMLVISFVFRRKTLHATRELYAELPGAGKRGVVLQTLGGGVFLTGNWLFFIYVMNHISIKTASFSYLICPILTTVLAFFILREHLSRLQWISVYLAIAGCAILGFNNLADLLYSLIVALSYALYLVTQRKNFGIDKFLLLTLQVLFSALLLLPFYPHFSAPLPRESFFYGLITIMALFFTIFPLLLNLYALKGLPSSTVGILLYITPLMGFIIAVLFFHEKFEMLQIPAYGIIAFSVILFNVKTGRAATVPERG